MKRTIGNYHQALVKVPFQRLINPADAPLGTAWGSSRGSDAQPSLGIID